MRKISLIAAQKFGQEFYEQVQFVEDDRHGYGNRFIDEVERAKELIQTHPEAWSKSGTIRKIHLKTFPNHAIRYRYNKSTGVVTLTRLSHSSQKL